MFFGPRTIGTRIIIETPVVSEHEKNKISRPQGRSSNGVRGYTDDIEVGNTDVKTDTSFPPSGFFNKIHGRIV